MLAPGIPLGVLNVTSYRVEHRAIPEEALAAALQDLEPALGPAAVAVETKVPPDRWRTIPLDLDATLRGKPGVVRTTLAVTGVVPGAEFQAEAAAQLRRPRTAVTQVTGIGLTVKSSVREGMLVWGTRLGDASPVEGAEIVVRDRNQPSEVLPAAPRTRFVDYTLEAATGRLLFAAPVPSLDAALNPVSIRVSYEVMGGGAAFWVAGGTGA